VSHAELAADLTGVDWLAFISERGVARDRKDPGTAREVGCQRFGDAVGKVIVLRATTNIQKRQHNNREPRRSLAGFGCPLASRPHSICRIRRQQLGLGWCAARFLPQPAGQAVATGGEMTTIGTEGKA